MGEGRPYLVVQHAIETASFWFKVLRVVDLEAATIGAIQLVTPKSNEWSHCSFGNGRESALANSVLGSPTPKVDGTARRIHATTATNGSWTWSQPPRFQAELPIALNELDMGETTAPAVFGIGAGSVSGLLDVSTNVWSPLEVPSSSRRGSGEGDLAIWTDYPTPGTARVRGWTQDGKGVRTIVDPAPFDTCQVVATPTHLIGFVAESGACEGSPTGTTAARLWRTPRAYDAAGASLSLSPPLPGAPFSLAGGFSLKAWGDYAVAQLWELDSAGAQVELYFLVVQLSTWKAWRIDPRPGAGLHGDGWTITGNTFYFGENADTRQEASFVRRVIRVPLAELANYAKALD